MAVVLIIIASIVLTSDYCQRQIKLAWHTCRYSASFSGSPTISNGQQLKARLKAFTDDPQAHIAFSAEQLFPVLVISRKQIALIDDSQMAVWDAGDAAWRCYFAPTWNISSMFFGLLKKTGLKGIQYDATGRYRFREWRLANGGYAKYEFKTTDVSNIDEYPNELSYANVIIYLNSKEVILDTISSVATVITLEKDSSIRKKMYQLSLNLWGYPATIDQVYVIVDSDSDHFYVTFQYKSRAGIRVYAVMDIISGYAYYYNLDKYTDFSNLVLYAVANGRYLVSEVPDLGKKARAIDLPWSIAFKKEQLYEPNAFGPS